VVWFAAYNYHYLQNINRVKNIDCRNVPVVVLIVKFPSIIVVAVSHGYLQNYTKCTIFCCCSDLNAGILYFCPTFAAAWFAISALTLLVWVTESALAYKNLLRLSSSVLCCGPSPAWSDSGKEG